MSNNNSTVRFLVTPRRPVQLLLPPGASGFFFTYEIIGSVLR